MFDPSLAHLASVSWGEVHAILRALETTLQHLTEAAGGPRALIEDALLITRDLLAKPGERPLLETVRDLCEILDKAVAEKLPPNPPED